MDKINVTFFEKHATKLLFIGLVLIIIAPATLTIPAFYTWLDFSKTGQIGDTIGGITAPIINFIGAILVYISFTSQQRANKLQWDAINLDGQIKYFDSSLEKLIGLKYDLNTINSEKNYFKHLRDQVREYDPRLNLIIEEFSFLNKLIMFLRYFNILYQRLNNSTLSLELKEYYRSSLFLETLDLHKRIIALNESFVIASKLSDDDPAFLSLKKNLGKLENESEKANEILQTLREEFHFENIKK